MTIIKEGNKDCFEKRRYFKCLKCGCLYSATKKEYHYEFDQKEGRQYCNCVCPMEWCDGMGKEVSYNEVEVYINDQEKWNNFIKTN